MNRPAYTISRAVLAIAGAAVALATGGCGSGVSGTSTQTGVAGTSKQTATSKTAEAPSPTNKLLATVSTTGAQVTLADSGGRTVTRVRSGWYSIFVTVNATGADFHLTGPSVDSATKVKVPGVALWGIHFLKGTYRYMNDRDAQATTRVLSVY